MGWPSFGGCAVAAGCSPPPHLVAGPNQFSLFSIVYFCPGPVGILSVHLLLDAPQTWDL